MIIPLLQGLNYIFQQLRQSLASMSLAQWVRTLHQICKVRFKLHWALSWGMDAFLVHILGNQGKFVCLHTLNRCHFLSIQIFFFFKTQWRLGAIFISNKGLEQALVVVLNHLNQRWCSNHLNYALVAENSPDFGKYSNRNSLPLKIFIHISICGNFGKLAEKFLSSHSQALEFSAYKRLSFDL